MLAGYLPFDDDPANPEGDNINLLYKYIVSTPLTFPEYVTPHARDLLKRILVPDPRKRADLFEVARHSWLADYSHVVGFITSSNTNSNDAQQASVYSSKSTTFIVSEICTNSYQKTRSNNNPVLHEAHPFASQERHMDQPLQLMVALQPSENRSTNHPLRKRRRAVITSVAQYKWNMLHLNRKRPVARPHHLRLNHRQCGLKILKFRPSTVISQHKARGQAVPQEDIPLMVLLLLVHLGQAGSLNDPFRIIRLLAQRPIPLTYGHQLEVHLVEVRECPREVTRMASHLLQQLSRHRPKVVSHSQRANSTQFRRHITSPSPLQ